MEIGLEPLYPTSGHASDYYSRPEQLPEPESFYASQNGRKIDNTKKPYKYYNLRIC